MFRESKGFVLPFTLFICAIMLLISTSISVILQKQIYFSQIARESQAAYYAADDAIACVLSIDETYVDAEGGGIFPYSTTTTFSEVDDKLIMKATFDYTTSNRAAQTPPFTPLANSYPEIKCSKSTMFDSTSNSTSKFTIKGVFSRTIPDPTDTSATITENGRTSTFTMKMDLGDGKTFRCANVTVHKTPSYRQIIAQGLSRCDRPDGSVERAVIDTTIQN